MMETKPSGFCYTIFCRCSSKVNTVSQVLCVENFYHWVTGNRQETRLHWSAANFDATLYTIFMLWNWDRIKFLSTFILAKAVLKFRCKLDCENTTWWHKRWFVGEWKSPFEVPNNILERKLHFNMRDCFLTGSTLSFRTVIIRKHKLLRLKPSKINSNILISLNKSSGVS